MGLAAAPPWVRDLCPPAFSSGLYATLLGAALISGTACAPPEPDASNVLLEPLPPLAVGAPRSVTLEPGKAVLFEFDLQVGEAMDLEVGQQAADVSLSLLAPGGETLLEADNPAGRTGPETLCFVARTAGPYALRLKTGQKKAGEVTVLLRHRRPATDEDRLCHEAGAAYWEARNVEEPAQAMAQLRRAAQLYRVAGKPFEASFTLYALGRRASREKGDQAAAEESYLEALALLDPLDLPAFQAAILATLGRSRTQVGRKADGEAALLESLELARRENLRDAEATALYYLASIHEARGELPAAVRRIREALAIWQELEDEYSQTVALQSLGAKYSYMARAQDGIGYLEESLSRAEALDDPLLMGTSLLHLGTAQLQLARDHPRSPQADEAVDSFRRSLAWFQEAGDYGGETIAMERLAGALARQGNLEEAQGHFEAALARSEGSLNPRHRAYTLLNLGCALEEGGLGAAAQAPLDEALELLAELEEEPFGEAQAQVCKARGHRRRGELQVGRTLLREAWARIEELRARSRRIGSSLAPIFLWQDYAELAAAVSIDLHAATGDAAYLREAFEIRDAARARQLADRLLGGSPALPVGQDPKLEEAIRAARVRLNQAREDKVRQERLLQERLHRAQGIPSPKTRGLLEPLAAPLDAVFDLNPELLSHSIRQQTLALHEAEDALRGSQGEAQQEAPQPHASTEALQAMLDDDTALLAYALGKESSWLFVLTRHTLDAHPLPPRSTLDLVARRHWAALQAEKGGRPSPQTAMDGSYLVSELLGPLLEASGNGARPARLIIIPEGMLAYLPFGALPLPEAGFPGGGQASSDGQARVVDAFELSYAPSASSLLALHRRAALRKKAPGPRSTLALVDAVYEAEDGRIDTPAPSHRVEDGHRVEDADRTADADRADLPLPRLEHSREEGKILEELLAPSQRQVFYGFEARRERLLSTPLGPLRILHLGAHAEIDEDHPDLSAIVLSRRNPAGEAVPGAILLHEISSLSLDVDLAVLSGCRTALGRNVRGAALHGLARGFFLAGASRLVVSLWSVDDEATAQLMVHFYRALLEDSLPPAALRQAQLQLRAEPRWQAPYYWAGFVLQGEG